MIRIRILPYFFRLIIVLLLLSGILNIQSEAAAKEVKQDYKTIVERGHSEPISPETYYDISFLTVKSLYHILEATKSIENKNIDNVKEELLKADKLVKIVQEMLPVTTVRMTVKGPDGQITYTDSREVREREVPIFAGMTTMEVVRPIIKYKKSHGKLKKFEQLEELDVFTLILVDVEYIRHQLDFCSSLLNANKIDEGYLKLEDAILFGIRLEVSEADKNLARTIECVIKSYKQIEDGHYKQARKSLKEARKSLSRYSKSVKDAEDEETENLLKEINELETTIEMEGKVKTKRIWTRLVKKLRSSYKLAPLDNKSQFPQ
ncbi:MAG: hypothetical protein SV062_13615 [Thermodesulfobacteriota bacterium]|nr:hypothetical protein [Thermodesulfobacteriota bacterium]